MANKTYCATGNMEIGIKVKNILAEIGRVLALNGYTLRSGGAPGAESAFEEGCDSENPILVDSPVFEGD